MQLRSWSRKCLAGWADFRSLPCPCYFSWTKSPRLRLPRQCHTFLLNAEIQRITFSQGFCSLDIAVQIVCAHVCPGGREIQRPGSNQGYDHPDHSCSKSLPLLWEIKIHKKSTPERWGEREGDLALSCNFLVLVYLLLHIFNWSVAGTV